MIHSRRDYRFVVDLRTTKGRPLMLYREGDIMNGISPADLVAGAVTVERVP